MLLLHSIVYDKQPFAEEDNREHPAMSEEPSGGTASWNYWWYSERGDVREDIQRVSKTCRKGL